MTRKYTKISKLITGKDYSRIHMEYKRESMNQKPFLDFNNQRILPRHIDEEEIFTYRDYHYINSLQNKNNSIMNQHIK